MNFDIRGTAYQSRKMPAYPDQLLLAKALLPLAKDVLPVILNILQDGSLVEKAKRGELEVGSPPGSASGYQRTV